MSRRRNPDNDTATPATPTTPDSAATDTPAPLPRAPVPPVMSRLDSARPGRRAEQPSENAVTRKLEKHPVEPTPAPLPPSPAAADAERWFEQIPTNPGAPRRDPSSIRDLRARTPAAGTLAPPAAATGAPLLTALIAATAFAVGMVVGALVFGHRGAAHCPPTTATPPPPATPAATAAPAPGR